MKKLILTCFLSAFCLGESLYPTLVKNVWIDENSKKIVGKLLPTNEIKVLERKDGIIKFEINGYQNPKAKNIIYFTPKARVIALSFAKNKAPEFKILSTKDGFNKVSTIAYTDDKDFSTNLDEIFNTAKTLYNENCGLCHALHDPSNYEANRLPSMFNSMASRTAIEKNMHHTVIQYLQKHSKDIK
ncbi:MAG: cytochrome C [Campylobacter sp.]|nr:cytochrome C [Campylobacter sp.]